MQDQLKYEKNYWKISNSSQQQLTDYVMLSWLRWRHLLEQIFTNNEGSWREESNKTNPNGVRANTSVAINDALVFIILLLDVSIWSYWPKDDDWEDLKHIYGYIKSDTWWKNIDFSTPHPPVKWNVNRKIFIDSHPTNCSHNNWRTLNKCDR